jgi:uncharacterized protein (TIGR03067 family)
LKKIQGTWVLVESTTKEHVLEKVREDSAEQFWRTFEGNTVTDWNKDKIRSGTFRLDPSVEPRKIDINWDDGNEYGIYKLEDDRLTICTARGDAKDRPNNFNPRALKGDDQALRVFKRSDKQKEEAPRPSPGRTEPDVVPPPLKGQPRKKPEREGPADDRLPPGKTPPRRSPGADRRLPPS